MFGLLIIVLSISIGNAKETAYIILCSPTIYFDISVKLHQFRGFISRYAVIFQNTDIINEIIASIMNIITSHFARSIEKPAIPRAPSMNAIKAMTRKNTAAPIKSTIPNPLPHFIK
jgi:hypothetical protein